MSAVAPLLYAAGVRQVTRSTSGVVAKAARGFQVFRVDGYSVTTTVPGGDRIVSDKFLVGGHNWYLDYYPNGTDMSKDSDSISLYLRLHGTGYSSFRVRAQYKFSLLDLAGNAAFELPTLDSTFTYAGGDKPDGDAFAYGNPFPEGSACGHTDFITREELERRREVLLQDDCLATRCDVGVMQLVPQAVTPKEKIPRHDSDDDDSYCGRDDDPWSSRHRRRRQTVPVMDDGEFIRRCLAQNRRV